MPAATRPKSKDARDHDSGDAKGTRVRTPAEEEDEEGLEETINPHDLYARPKPAPAEWIDLTLQAVNGKRMMHWTPPLIWSELCYEYAKRQADSCMASGKLQHGLSDTIQGRLGQLILGPRDGGPWRMNRPGCAQKIVDLWYKEISGYKFDHPGHHEKTANFEQVVWFGTTSIGLALSKDGRYVVANFYPAGPDSHCEPPGEKGRKMYFPAGSDSTGHVLDLTNQDKYRSWFKTNVLPLKDGPAPWLGGVERAESPSGSEKRGTSPGSPGSGKRSTSPKGKAKKKGMKKGQSSKALGRSTSRGSGRSMSRSSSRKSTSPGPGDTRKKDGMKLMTPNSRSKSPKSPKSPKSRPRSKGAKS